MLKYCSDVDNKVVNALSRKLCTLQSLSATMIGFECLIHEYPTCLDFGDDIYIFDSRSTYRCRRFHYY